MADSSSPAAVATATFSTQRKGFDQTEVRSFLQQVSAALARSQASEADLMRQLADIRVEVESLRAKPPAPSELDEATVANLLGQEAARVLTTAREGAASLRARVEGEVDVSRIEAERDITRMRDEALDDTTRQRSAAEEEAALIRKNAAEAAEREMESAKSQGREMVLEARAYRERVMADLARRREAAREQIHILRQQRARLRASFSTVEMALGEIRGELADDIPDPDPLEDPTGISGAFPVVATVTAPSTYMPSGSVPTSALSSGSSGRVTGGFTIGEYPLPASDTGLQPDDAHVLDEGDNSFAGEVDQSPASPPSADEVVASMATTEAVAEADGDGDGDGDGEQHVDVPDDDESVEVVDNEPSAATEIETGEVDDAEERATDEAEAAVGTDAGDATDPGNAADAAVETDAGDATDPGNAADASDASNAIGTAADATANGIAANLSSAHRPVDDLFARIRAGRITEVAHLQEMPAHAQRPEPSGDGTPVGETVSQAHAPIGEQSKASTNQRVAGGSTNEGASGGGADRAYAAEVLLERETALGPLEISISRRLKRVLADEQSEALDQLRRRSTTPAAADLFGDVVSHARRYQEAARDDLHQAARIGAMSIATLTSAELAELAAAEDVIGHALHEVEREMVGPLRAHLDRTVEVAGDDTDEAAAQLRAVYREWKVQRIDAMVSHLVLTAHGRGAFAALLPGTPVCWIVDEAKSPCAEGDDNALAGAVPCGEEFPTGHRSVPAYTGCRCAIAPVSR